MIVHSTPPPRLARYTTTITAAATIEVARIQMHPNSAVLIQAKGDQNFTLTVTNIDTEDDVEYDVTSYAVTSAAPVAVWARGGVGVLIEATAAGANVVPDIRVWGMSQP